MIKRYQFGHTKIEVRLPKEMRIPENMSLFEVEAESVHKICKLEFVDELETKEREFRVRYPEARELLRKNMRLLLADDKECRILNFESALKPYALHVEESGEFTQVWVSREVQGMLQFDTIFVSLLGLEKVMIRNEALILHSAYMCRDGKAILFSAPSETGKSTQASLWEKHRGTRTINGDRSLLHREADGWWAHGWPICGSSEICHNEAYPIQAIVMLRQAKENEVKRLGVMEAMKKLMAQITINMWNSEYQIHAMDLIQQLIMEVPVYELGCNISEEAVECLERVL